MKEKKSNKALIWIVAIFLSISAGVLATLLLIKYTSFASSFIGTAEDAQQEQAEDATDTADAEATETQNATPTTETWTGDYLTATVPTDWYIVEYTTEAGSDMLMDGTSYSGLVAFRVFDENDTEMFYTKGVDGIGGTLGCDNTYDFGDTSANYLAHGNDLTNLVGTTPSVVDMTSATYVEYMLLGQLVRRVGTDIYRDAYPTESGFNTACGIDGGFVELTSLGHTRTLSGVTDTNYTYAWQIIGTPSAAELLELDSVLESLTAL